MTNTKNKKSELFVSEFKENDPGIISNHGVFPDLRIFFGATKKISGEELKIY